MYAKVLVPVAPDEVRDLDTAFAVARTLAGTSGEICALSVIEPLPTYTSAYVADIALQRPADDVRAALESAAAGRASEVAVDIGPAAPTILRWAKDHDVDCIVVASHRPGFGDFLIGSTAARIVRHAACPVMVVR